MEYKETIASGTRAAAKGGFTTVCAMPNTEPTMHTRATVEYVLEKARTEGAVRVLPIGCVTKGSRGKELAEMMELAEAGCIGFSDDGHPVSDSNIMRQALSYASGLGLPIINHCETPDLFRGGHMNEGWVSNRLGVQGAPNSAEETMVARDISLAELTGGHVHLAHISTAGTLDLVTPRQRRRNPRHLRGDAPPPDADRRERSWAGRGAAPSRRSARTPTTPTPRSTRRSGRDPT